jgi:uncharacterized protein (DUF302 family)
MHLMIVKASKSDYAETIRSLVNAIERRGLTVFARIDHAAAAREVGLELADEQVVLFGDPRSGTPLMRSDRRVGVELPLRILVWREAQEVSLGYRDPRELSHAYNLTEHGSTLERMAALLDELVAEAGGDPGGVQQSAGDSGGVQQSASNLAEAQQSAGDHGGAQQR